jgi:hypothetical protein
MRDMEITLTEDEQSALRDALHDWSHVAAAWMSQGDENVQVTWRNLERIMRELRVMPKEW